MIKQIFSLTLLLVANFVLLAHEIIPHHHHDENICLEHHSSEEHPGQQSENEGQTNDDQCCLLSGIIVVNARNIDLREEISSYSILKQFQYHQAFIFVEAFIGFEKLLFSGFCRQNVFRYSLFSEYLNRAIGLRAPPQS